MHAAPVHKDCPVLLAAPFAALHLTHALAVCKGSVLTRRPSSAGVGSHAARCCAAPDEEDTQAVQRRASESTLGTHEGVCC